MFDCYQAYVALLFQTYTGLGHDAKLRTSVASRDGSRKERGNYTWKADWEDPRSGLFADPEVAPVANKADVRAAYERVMEALTKSLGTQR